MKALIWERYGPPDKLRLGEVDKPQPRADEVLRIRAVSVNPRRARPGRSRRPAPPPMPVAS